MFGKGSWSMKGRRVELRIGSPIDPNNYSYESRRELAQFVREKVKELM